MNITEVNNITYYQCGGVRNFVSNFGGYYGLGSAYTCGYQQALWKSNGEHLRIPSSWTFFLVYLMLVGIVFADVGPEMLAIIG